MKHAIEIENLTKEYSGFKLDNISFAIPKGTIVGLIGENGAGKTTLIKTILNIIKKDRGNIRIFDKDLAKEEVLIKEDVGVVLDDIFLPNILNANGINTTMKSVFKNWDSELFYQYLKWFNIPVNKQIKELSKGMNKKLEIATALSHKPKLLILDEPTSGLDPVVRNEVLDIFLDYIQDEDNTILLSTHITSDLEHIADEIIFINQGKLLMEESRDNIFDNYGILKCGVDDFKNIDKKDIVSYKKNKYDYQILIKEKEQIKKKYKDYVVDNITLEDLMVLTIKGSER